MTYTKLKNIFIYKACIYTIIGALFHLAYAYGGYRGETDAKLNCVQTNQQ